MVQRPHLGTIRADLAYCYRKQGRSCSHGFCMPARFSGWNVSSSATAFYYDGHALDKRHLRRRKSSAI